MMERFWSKVEVQGDCLIWVAAKLVNGYGAFKLGGKRVSSHRYIYTVFYGDIPEQMDVCHSCDNRACVNPSHLWLGSRSDNMQDCVDKGRFYKKPRTYNHGTNTCYGYGCRCRLCKTAHRLANAKYRLALA